MMTSDAVQQTEKYCILEYARSKILSTICICIQARKSNKSLNTAMMIVRLTVPWLPFEVGGPTNKIR